MTSRWRAEGTFYEREWGGRTWRVRVDEPKVGLRGEDSRVGPILALEGLSDSGRVDPNAFGPASLIGHEVRFDRVEATFAPEGWGSLRIRAAWEARGDDVVDLEIQAQAFTVGDFEAVEVLVASSRLGSTGLEELDSPDPSIVANVRRAGSTIPVSAARSFAPLGADFRAVGRGLPYYLEMIHPDDGLRREVDAASATVRYALFGYDLERGVIVRGRLRGIWYATRPDEAEVSRRWDEFLSEPPPLGI